MHSTFFTVVTIKNIVVIKMKQHRYVEFFYIYLTLEVFTDHHRRRHIKGLELNRNPNTFYELTIRLISVLGILIETSVCQLWYYILKYGSQEMGS